MTGLWFDGEKYYAWNLDAKHEEKELPVFSEAKRWLDIYFSGREPDFMPPMHMLGTNFQKEVWKILRTIPYGETTTYGEIAAKIAKQRGLARMSAQAVGNAVGRNELSILIPVSYTHLDVYKRQILDISTVTIFSTIPLDIM